MNSEKSNRWNDMIRKPPLDACLSFGRAPPGTMIRLSTYCYILFEYISARFGGYAVAIAIGKCYAFIRNKVEARFTKSTVGLQEGSRDSRRAGKEKTPKASEAEAWPGYMQKMHITVA